MSTNLESNKIFAAILVAGITAMIAGFVAKKLVHPHDIEEDAVYIDGGAVATTGASKPQMPEPIMDLIATADIAKGEKLSKACAACHSFDQGGANKVGPNLWGVVGAKKGAHAGFSYSEDMVAHGGTWSYDELNYFLWKPKVLIAGTKMNYMGLKKPEDRAAMIAWLRTLGGSLGNPTEAQIAEEKARLAPEEAETTEGEGAEEAAE